MVEIYLIGTQHYDVKGPSKLEVALAEIKPDIVLVEGDSRNIPAQQKYVAFLKDELIKRRVDGRIRDETLRFHGSKGYEWVIGQRYCESNGAEFDFLKDDCLDITTNGEIRSAAVHEARIAGSQTLDGCLQSSRKRQSEIERDWTYLKRTEGTEQESIDIDKGITKSGEDYAVRDAQMEVTLRQKVLSNTGKRIVTITGFAHILNDLKNRNLYGRIRDLNPQRKFLY